MRARRFVAVASAIIAVLLLLTPTACAGTSELQAGQKSNGSCAPVPNVDTKPFLKIPFAEKDAKNSLIVSNGWNMATDEVAIAGPDLHAAIDFEFTRQKDHGYGLEIRAAAAGKAYYSFQQFTVTITDKYGVPHEYGLGAGNVIEIHHANGWVTQYAHPSKVRPGIPYIGAVEDPKGSGEWRPSGILKPDAELEAFGVYVEQDELIAWQGITGAGDNQKDVFDGATGQVIRYTTQQWDPTQLHFQLYQGRDETKPEFPKKNVVDVFGREGDGLITPERNPYMKRPGEFCSSGYFITDKHGQPVYAVQ